MPYSKFVSYIIHDHHADRAGHHYDLRIEHPRRRFLMSWALPKARIPQVWKDKVLAVEVEPHKMRWLDVEGVIEDGYGKGRISILQTGKLELKGFGTTHITFVVEGKHMNGKYVLIKHKKEAKTWFLIKARD